MMKKSLLFILYYLFFSVATLSLCACYNKGQQTPDAIDITEAQLDSISFFSTHHYTENFNFFVHADSFHMIAQHPAEWVSEMPVDTLTVFRGDRLVVADITIMPADSIDSVWVKVARDQLTLGWIHENELLPCVSPDDTISRFIDFFSDSHLLIFLAFLVLTVSAYVIRRLLQQNSPVVHFRDIPSIYPTLLCLLVAASATIYSSIQMQEPEMWRHFYYHPTLNPFVLPSALSWFITSIWGILILLIASLLETHRLLSLGDALLYCFGLVSVCAVVYVVFSVTTLYYIGYPLFIAYAAFALWRYYRYSLPRYICGNCGARLTQKGRCPQCGMFNE